jgi:hypothetical protein
MERLERDDGRWYPDASASWLTPSIKPPSPAMIVCMMINERFSKTRRRHSLCDRHADSSC